MQLSRISLFILISFLPLAAGAQQAGIIEGHITDAVNGDSLIAANVSITENFKGTSSGRYGYYRLDNIEPGRYLITSSYIGYEKFDKVVVVTAGEKIKLNIQLYPKSYQLEELIVQSAKKRSPEIGLARVESSFINQLPAMVEEDLFRSLQLLPGVSASSEISSGLYIRGGSPDQTLILFDKAPVYNPSHFFGFYSTFNPHIINDVELYKGNYPAKYGGRLGSVLSIESQSGKRNESGGKLALGMLAAGITLEGPVLDKKGSLMLSMRRSTLDPVLKILRDSHENIPRSFYFMDLNGKFDYESNEKNRFSLSFYSGADRLQFPFADDAGIHLNYGNQVLSGNWQRISDDKLFMDLNISASRYFNYPSYNIASTASEQQNTINEFSFRNDLEYLPNRSHELLLGLEMNSRSLRLNESYGGETIFDSQIHSFHSSLYLQHNWSISDRFLFSPALRLNHSPLRRHLQVQPRITLAYHPHEHVHLQAAYGRYEQFLTLSSNENFSGLDLWLAADKGVKPAYGRQYGLSLKTLPWEGHHFNIEFYYRDMARLFEPDPFLPDRSGMDYRDIFRYGKGYAYGTEVLFRREIGRITGFVGYTFSLSRRNFSHINEASGGSSGYYPAKFDRNHDLNIVLSCDISQRWTFTSVFSYTSGQPYTEPLGRSFSFESPFSARGRHQIVSGKVNASRMPPYHRLDLGMSRKSSFFGIGDADWKFQIINVYSRRNVWFYNFDLNKNGPEQRSEVQLLPVLPSIAYSLNF